MLLRSLGYARRIEAHCVSPRRYRKPFEFENVTMALAPHAVLDAVHLRAIVRGAGSFGDRGSRSLFVSYSSRCGA